MNDDIQSQITQMIATSKVFIFMKGSPSIPQCGFSMRAIDILKKLGTEFQHFDVLTDEHIRQGIKEYSDWPTIPQLYIDAKFVGGCDIIETMYTSGELKKLIDKTVQQ